MVRLKVTTSLLEHEVSIAFLPPSAKEGGRKGGREREREKEGGRGREREKGREGGREGEYGGPGGHASHQWLSRITPVSFPPTVVMSPPSVTLMSVPFSLRTVAIPVHMLLTRPVQARGVIIDADCHTPCRVQYARAYIGRRSQCVVSSLLELCS